MVTHKKRELTYVLVSFSGAVILLAVIFFKQQAPFHYVLTRLHWVLVVGIVFYGISVILRILYSLVSRFWMRK